MSQSNGKPASSPYRRAVERHRAEQAAWQRVKKCQIALRAAIEEYNSVVKWADMPGLPLPGSSVDQPPINGLVELPDVIVSFEDMLAAESDADAEAAERPSDSGNPAVDAFVERERAAAREKRRAKKEKRPEVESESDQAAAMVRNPALDRLAGLLDSQDPSRWLNGQQTDPGALGPWTSQDLEDELLHALGSSGLEAGLVWGALIRNGATNEEILEHLGGIWPRIRKIVEPAADRKLGYTIIYGTSQPVFWLGKLGGGSRQPTLAGTQLVDRIRTVLEIPTPSQAQKKAQQTFRDACINQGIPMNPLPEEQPVKRGRGRPPGSKTRKAVEL